MSRPKRYAEMTVEELTAATVQFDDPCYNPPATKPTARQTSQLRTWQRKRATERATLSLSLEKELITRADAYAADHGITFSELVSNALRRLMRKSLRGRGMHRSKTTAN